MGFEMIDWLARRAELTPERTAMEDVHGGVCMSYRALDRRAGQAASLLAGEGVEAGDRVAVLCRNRIEFFELLFACARLGAILVPLNWRMPAPELSALLDDCGARLLLHGAEDAATVTRLAADRLATLDLDGNAADGYASRRDALAPLDGQRRHDADEPWYLLYTSGTTGLPKAVIQTYGMALANYVNISQGMGLTGEDETLCFLPLFHTAGINLVALPVLMLGGCVRILPRFDAAATLDLVAEGRLNVFFGVPAVYQAMALDPRFETADLSGVRCWGCGGAPMPDTLLETWAAKGAVVLNGMGMTETGPTAFLMDAARARDKIGSVGKPQLLCDVRIVGPDGEDAAPGEDGELWFAGPGITPGYWGREEATREALPDGRWLRSGDLARQDEDGYYYIVGRLKDMYISGGENVYPAEVERALAEHPAVLEAAVVGVPDERWGEVGFAWIELRPGHQMPEDDALRTFLRERLAAYKVPKRFAAIDAFPRTAAGKVQKHLLPEPDSAAQ